MNRLLLIDGDILVFQHAASAEESCEWDDGMWTSHADADVAQDRITEELSSLMKKLDADDFVICFSCMDGGNWRKEIYPEYKANRKGARVPILRKELTKWCTEQWPCKWKPNLEADDVMGIIATNPKLYKGSDKVIVSIDKDLMQIPGQVFDGDELHDITEEQGDYTHLLQTLTGDQVDNYPGCPGYGAVSARRVLDKDPSWDAVLATFEKVGCHEQDALIMARIARICRHSDFNYKKQEPKLWTPTPSA